MNKFEEGALKNQKLTKKQCISKPEFKQQYIQPIQSLPSDFQTEQLQKVLDNEIRIADLKEIAGKYRSMETIKKAFKNCTNVSSWEEARERFPRHTTAERLDSFTHLSFKDNVPEAFVSFCQAALQNELLEGSENMITSDECVGYFIKKDVKKTTYSEIREHGYKTFMGADLFIFKSSQVYISCYSNKSVIYIFNRK